jgi:hypothetical protein
MDEGPVTARVFLADLLRMFGFMAVVGVLFTVLVSGLGAITSLLLWSFGYRPIGLGDTLLAWGFFIVTVPLCFFLAMIAMVAAFWSYRSWRWFVAHLGIAVLATAGGGAYLFLNRLAPALAAGQHLTTWPAALALVSFDVCAIEVEEEPDSTRAPLGRIAFVLQNLSPETLEEARFSVHAGSTWLRFEVGDLAPRDSRLVETEADLGTIESQLAGQFTGWARPPAILYWDAVRFRTGERPTLGSRPAAAQLWPIRDCPRHDLAGTWRGSDGTEMVLHQRGRWPRGFVRGGQLSTFPNPLSGTFDGTVLKGTFDHRAGRSLSSGEFSLTRSAPGRLDGSWWLTQGEMKGTGGTWSLVLVAPGEPAPPRR